jgi:hypothetical protein
VRGSAAGNSARLNRPANSATVAIGPSADKGNLPSGLSRGINPDGTSLPSAWTKRCARRRRRCNTPGTRLSLEERLASRYILRSYFVREGLA